MGCKDFFDRAKRELLNDLRFNMMRFDPTPASPLGSSSSDTLTGPFSSMLLS